MNQRPKRKYPINDEIHRSKFIDGKIHYPPHYFRWRQMKRRCFNPKDREFCRYGARGITVCLEWLEFRVFQAWCLSTFEQGKTMDRINNDGPYSPENCRWATPSEQQVSARRTQAKRDAIKIAKKAWVDKKCYLNRKRNEHGQFI